MTDRTDAGQGRGPTEAEGPVPRGTARALCEEYDAALCDLDGVVYVGGAAVPGAAEALRAARAAGMGVAFVTNNASRTPSAVAARLTRFGVPATAADVVTSAQAAARLIAERFPAGSPVLVVGANGLRTALRERGLRPVTSAEDEPVAVVQGYNPRLGYDQLAEGTVAVRRGALFVASNGDTTVPGRRGPEPGNGAMIRVIATAAGVEPVVAGKPEPPMHREGVLRTGAKRPLIVGDRLDTDIEGASRGGADSLLVLTGVTTPAELVAASPEHRPTYLAAGLDGLLAPHPEVKEGPDGHACGGWTVRIRDGRPEITGSGDPLDGLRALCAVAWTSTTPPTPSTIETALKTLGAL
ncbi:MAG: HAD-IIA family hydrolase [Streptosporangiales bacterium]|nr:HAD-IIA family hydrolase [Streptosporangiales bacterium]